MSTRRVSPLTFNTGIIKGGALLEDTRRLLDLCDPELPPQENIRRLAQIGFGKTQARREDLLPILARRFLEPGAQLVRALKLLVSDRQAFLEACYYETARTDPLVAAFAQGPLYRWWHEGHRQVTRRDVLTWLQSFPATAAWGDYTRVRVAQGLLASLRDFGLLEGPRGGPRKWILPPHLSLRGFGYVALRERSRIRSDHGLIHSSVWRRYLLDHDAVRALFREADRAGILRFSEAGTIVRIDWLVTDLVEVARVAA
jgi:hypothetical protein